ncbi:E3 ubiquitin-protein ligase [Striga asiatica]|uniref:E3 ubiquitin-protein ligase n=1 Tax=Striga asiatica TaxID=4170 RepID=A0A5A7QKK0_STRAF|nr:E3 ubiquitin-protein ligase [Striga asiatica]
MENETLRKMLDKIKARRKNRSKQRPENVGERKRKTDTLSEQTERKKPKLTYETKEEGGFLNRVSSLALCKFFKDLDDRQKEDVKSIGFGHLLDMKITQIAPANLCYFLVTKYRYASNTLILRGNREMNITAEDVEAILGLPRGPKEVIEGDWYDKDEQYNKMLGDFRETFGFKRTAGAPTAKKLVQYLTGKDVERGQRVYGDDFKRIFVIAVVSLFLWRNRGQECKFRLLKSLRKPSDIINYNWCQYVLQALSESVKMWNESGGEAHFNGPLTFLVVCYLDRVQFMNKTYVSRKFPAIAYWTNQAISKRVREEQSGQGFGMGSILDPIKPPRDGSDQAATLADEHVVEKQQENLVERFERAMTNIAPFVSEVREVCERAKSSDLGAALIIHHALQNHVSVIMKIAQGVIDAQTNEGIDDEMGSDGQEQEQDAENKDEESIHVEVGDDVLVQEQERIENEVANDREEQEQEQEQKQNGENKDEESIHVEVGDDVLVQEQEGIENEVANDREEQKQEQEQEQNGENEEEKEDDGVERNEGIETEMATDGQQETHDTGIQSILSDIFNEYGDGQDSNKEVDEDEVVVQEREGIQKELATDGQQQAQDTGHVEIRGKCTLKERAFWNFTMEGDNDNAEKTTEVIFEGLQLACTREDFKTFNLGEYISSTIVDTWAMHLNFRFHSLNKNKSKFCLTTNVMMGLSLQAMSNRDPNEYVREAAARMDVEFTEQGLSIHDIKNINHLIVPVCFQTHFYLYCLDFENKKLGILDNMDTVLSGNVPLKNKYGGTKDFLKKVIEAYRKMYKKPFKTPLSKLILKLVNMHCADSTNTTDCGIYAMHHMSKYVCVHADSHDCAFPQIGSDSRKKVHMKNKLDTLRVKYLAKLIESPINKKSDVVREDLSNYFAEKTIE